MQLYVCYGTFELPYIKGGHPCRKAYVALTEAGYSPEVTRTYGCVLNERFKGRCEVKALTGNYLVPTLVLDDGTVIDESANIMAWAEANPNPAEPARPS